ncbi:hypothetical protein KCU65_g91, partial [Aureobasidium melanogenum]
MDPAANPKQSAAKRASCDISPNSVHTFATDGLPSCITYLLNTGRASSIISSSELLNDSTSRRHAMCKRPWRDIALNLTASVTNPAELTADRSRPLKRSMNFVFTTAHLDRDQSQRLVSAIINGHVPPQSHRTQSESIRVNPQ